MWGSVPMATKIRGRSSPSYKMLLLLALHIHRAEPRETGANYNVSITYFMKMKSTYFYQN